MKAATASTIGFFAISFYPWTVAFQTKPSLTPRNVIATRQQQRTRVVCEAAISGGDTVLVIGGTGGVGQLVTKKLLQLGEYKVRVASRDVQRGKATIDDNNAEVVPLDLTGDSIDAQLKATMEGVAAIVVSVGTTAFPTAKWVGGNSPEAIDKVAVTKIANVAASVAGLKKAVLITSIGVDRTSDMPFKVLNLFGVLDAKRSGEEAIKAAAQNSGFDYVLVRPGRLVGGPWTNYDVANLLKLEGGAENGVQIELGDSLLGDCKRDACAEAIVQGLINTECSNLAFSMVTTDKPALTNQQWTSEFQRLKQLAPSLI